MSHLETAQQILARLRSPAVEFRFLLSRGYRRAHALRCVGEHHQLTSSDRNVLERVVFPTAEASLRKDRLITEALLDESSVAIDGYNVLISLECLLSGEPLFLADDGVLRDIAARRGLRHKGGASAEAASRLCKFFSGHNPKEVTFIFDRQVSRSGDLAAACAAELALVGVEGGARTETRADRALINASSKAVICTSDRVIIDSSPRVFDAVRALADGLQATPVGHFRRLRFRSSVPVHNPPVAPESHGAYLCQGGASTPQQGRPEK